MPPHPLDQDTALLRGRGFLRFERTVPDGGRGWHRCADLVQGPDPLDGTHPLDAWTARVERWLHGTGGRAPHPSVAPTYLMGWYLDAVARTGSTWLELCGRLPGLGPADLALHETPGGWPDAVAVTGRAFRCASGDPDADHPDAVLSHDLRADLRAGVEAHARVFHAAFRPSVKTGSRQRWGMVEDVLEASTWAARDLARARPNPLPGVRRSCCFAYRVDPALLCGRCPRRVRQVGPGR